MCGCCAHSLQDARKKHVFCGQEKLSKCSAHDVSGPERKPCTGIHKGRLIEYFDAPVETVIFPLAIRRRIPLARFGEWSSKVKGLSFNLSNANNKI